MFFKQLLQSSTIRFCLIALILCGVALTGSRAAGRVSAAAPQVMGMAQTTAPAVVDPNAPTEHIFVRCSVLETGMDYRADVVFIRSTDCAPSTGAIQYFVVIGTDSRKANQVLSVGLTAKATGESVVIWYDSSDTNVPNPEATRKLLTAAVE